MQPDLSITNHVNTATTGEWIARSCMLTVFPLSLDMLRLYYAYCSSPLKKSETQQFVFTEYEAFYSINIPFMTLL